MQMQAEDLRIYALAYALWHDDTCISLLVGRKDDPKAQELFTAAIRQPIAYKRIVAAP